MEVYSAIFLDFGIRMEVSGQLHDIAALPKTKEQHASIVQETCNSQGCIFLC